MGRQRDELSPRVRSFLAGDYIILYRVGEDEVVLILFVFYGNQDIETLFRH